MNRRHGLTGHRMWLQVLPEGNAVAVYAFEGAGAATFSSNITAAKHPFETWFVDRLVAAHALNLASGPVAPPAELGADWQG